MILQPGYQQMWTFVRADKRPAYAALLQARGYATAADALLYVSTPLWLVSEDPDIDPPSWYHNGWVLTDAEVAQFIDDLGGMGTVNKGNKSTNLAFMVSGESGGTVPPEGWNRNNVLTETDRKPEAMQVQTPPESVTTTEGVATRIVRLFKRDYARTKHDMRMLKYRFMA